MAPETYYGLDNLDQRLIPYLPPTGFFVELGAYDGVNQNNTYWLEQHGWRGLLIEPVPDVYEACIRNRPLAKVIRCACVSPSYMEPEVEMIYSGLMSIVRGARRSDAADEEWVRRGEEIQDLTRYSFRAPARTLGSVLVEHDVGRIDLLSVDAEGFEQQILEGLDFRTQRPANLLVEESDTSDLAAFLAERGYRPVAELSHRRFTRDVLYQPREGHDRLS
jgi:FkbM family methyltransferase